MSDKVQYSSIAEIPTPAMVIDASVVQRNIERLATYVKTHGFGLRPHTKTHKSRFVAARQREAGAMGLTVAKMGEAEQMVHETSDLLVAYPTVDPARTIRAAQLARENTIRVAIDSTTAVEALGSAARSAGSTIGLLVEIDVGLGRTGVASPADALQLAQFIDRQPGVKLEGIMCYPGQIWDLPDRQAASLRIVSALLQETIDLWRTSGLAANIVSGGSTPTAFQSHLVPQYTEIRPGTYVFNDVNTMRGGYCTLEDCAARILFTVVSDAVPRQVVLDGGTKTLTSDRCIPAPETGHGHLVEYPAAKITRLSEEHGQVDVSQCARVPRVGERVTVIPNHICPCVNLQDSMWWLETDGTVRRITVDTRGKLS